jgi:GT2 family glycosyltransferase
MSIPVIGTAVVTNPGWVERLYRSIDFPVDNFFIVNNNGKGEITEQLDSLGDSPNPHVRRLHVSHMPSNLGVSASWNLVIKSYLNCRYWVIANDDVAFMPGLLEEMHSVATDPEVGVINPFRGDYDLGAWDLFLIKDWVVRTHGLFDENLYPAYCEDADYIMRLTNMPVKKVVGLKTKYMHGDGMCDEYYTHGSQTKKSSDELYDKLQHINVTNFTYMNAKWGEGWRNCQPWSHPFGNEQNKVGATTWDLDFVRSKSLGF